MLLTLSWEVHSVNSWVDLGATGLVWRQSNKGQCCHAVTGWLGFIIKWGLILIFHFKYLKYLHLYAVLDTGLGQFFILKSSVPFFSEQPKVFTTSSFYYSTYNMMTVILLLILSSVIIMFKSLTTKHKIHTFFKGPNIWNMMSAGWDYVIALIWISQEKLMDIRSTCFLHIIFRVPQIKHVLQPTKSSTTGYLWKLVQISHWIRLGDSI